MLYVGLDLSRKRVDFDARRRDGELVERGSLPPDADGLRLLVRRLGDADVVAVIESMNGARFVHDQLELQGWDVRIADAAKAKGLAPLACKTDAIDARVLAELGRRDLVPEIWLPSPEVRAERERARFRLHLVKHRSALKNRVHAILIAYGIPSPSSDLFGDAGRRLLARLELPEPWCSTTAASIALIDVLDEQIAACERELRTLGADHRYVPLLMTTPGIGWILAYTIASEIGDIRRFAAPAKLVGYSGLTPSVSQSGEHDRRGPCARTVPTICAGRWSRPRTRPAAIPSTNRPSSATVPATGARKEPRPRRSRSPANSPKRPGTCSPKTNRLLRQAPPRAWPPDGPLGNAPPERTPTNSSPRGAIER